MYAILYAYVQMVNLCGGQKSQFSPVVVAGMELRSLASVASAFTC